MKFQKTSYNAELADLPSPTTSPNISLPHTGQFYYEIHSGPKKIEKKLTISNLKMPFTSFRLESKSFGLDPRSIALAIEV